MVNNYADYYDQLRGLTRNLKAGLPGPMTGFGELHREAVTDGVLSRKVKELMALAIAITVRCDGCIAFHTRDALRAGATREEVLETIGVALLMGGGPAMVYGAEALAALEQFNAASEAKPADMPLPHPS